MHNNPGQLDPRLATQCPAQGQYLWDIFNTLGRASTQGFSYITQQEIAAWQQNYRTRLTVWEIDTLRVIDNVAARSASRNQPKA